MNYAILGATGRVGGATATVLLAQGHRVRVVVRRPESVASWRARGADVTLAEITDARALATAFAGVDGVFVATPPFLEVEDPIAANRSVVAALCPALALAGVERLVFLSSVGAQHATGLGAIAGLHELEAALFALPMPSVALRAGWFVENHRGQIDAARETGVLASMLDPLDLAVPMIATNDIGTAAAMLLQRDSHANQSVVELSMEQPHSMNDVAATMSSLLERPVTAQIIPKSERVAAYRAWGASDAAARAMSRMIDGFNSGWIAFEGPPAERLFGTTTLEASLKSFTAEATFVVR